ncbi:MAG: methionyl-tRNA formyltransferase [Candidatus Coatesbacteria bacterium]|nr:methionyl-tRNA formyltransferase [Candidatus Coatesbacteria bacterium]
MPSLKLLFESRRFDMMCVTQPDQPSGRGLKLTPCPCKALAHEFGLDVFCPERVSRQEPREVLTAFEPDFIVTVAFGQLLKETVLNIPKIACVNVHPSLLPKYRGPSPINWPIIRGDRETGVTTMLMDKGMDTGDILLQEKVPIGDDDTALDLYNRLSEVGAALLLKTLIALEEGTLKPTKQEHEKATYAPKLTKTDGLIEWSKDPRTLVNYVRGLIPWPGTYAYYKGRILKIARLAEAECPEEFGDTPPGTVIAASAREGLVVKTNPGAVSIELIQPPGKRQMSAKEFLAGNAVKVGQQLSKVVE